MVNEVAVMEARQEAIEQSSLRKLTNIGNCTRPFMHQHKILLFLAIHLI